ncbi:MAG TPA: metallophosphoesterase [Bradyrhizobium sp.]|nr:metallophosphoesterase [Bradyrhizobium sp.]
MATPSVMLRFSYRNASAIDEHNKTFAQKGRVLWGLWLKSFENADETLRQLQNRNIDRIYIADTTSKATPSIYVCDVKRLVIRAEDVEEDLVPQYYQDRKAEVKIWFELASRIGAIDADKKLIELLGVPTIYFLDYDKAGNIINAAPQRLYEIKIDEKARWALLISDVHLGDDHAFRYPGEKSKTDSSAQRILSEVIREDLTDLDALGKIGCVIVAGDILTKGAWFTQHQAVGREVTGLELAQLFLEDLSEAVSVDRNHFLMVPGNHDIVRKATDADQVQEALLHYEHERGFRVLREEFSQVYKLSPLNYVVQISTGDRKLLVGMLNSAYLNEETKFSDYGYVGDDAEKVFELFERETSESVAKIVILHHHLLPVYEREVIATSGKIAVTLDAVRLLRRAQETGVSTIVHGHQHSTKRMIFSACSPEMSKKSRDEGRFVTIVAAGSSGAKRDRLPSDETNAYALVDLASKEPSVKIRRIFPDGRRGEDW